MDRPKDALLELRLAALRPREPAPPRPPPLLLRAPKVPDELDRGEVRDRPELDDLDRPLLGREAPERDLVDRDRLDEARPLVRRPPIPRPLDLAMRAS
ncbi:hypothetical protein [Pseudactinotalea sp. Z1732]|uniref:hypothetical protein n=1 Tax=Pseudactinotalea sp. Z1732 TaxID=3413026 RepID=UPI003C7EB130